MLFCMEHRDWLVEREMLRMQVSLENYFSETAKKIKSVHVVHISFYKKRITTSLVSPSGDIKQFLFNSRMFMKRLHMSSSRGAHGKVSWWRWWTIYCDIHRYPLLLLLCNVLRREFRELSFRITLYIAV